ncbi:MAG: phosphatase PAP2 family protein [Fibrobacter sp.]|nr:phosphatase PAP2 family protein [Fibrobacter sp.]
MFKWLQKQDIRFYSFLTSRQVSPKVNKFLRFYTRLGDGYVWVLVLIVLFSQNTWIELQPMVVRALTAAGVSLALYWLVKLSTRRKRPFVALKEVKAQVPPLDKYSFPSGHVMNNIAPGMVIFMLNPFIGWIVVLMPLSWGMLRVYFGVHWLSDIIAGALLGVLSAFISLFVLFPPL